jgi:hypothetical protein
MIRTLVAGLGTMGRSHALAYHRNPAFDLVGLVNRSTPKLDPELARLHGRAGLQTGSDKAET